jgi:type II secretory pathway component PulM
VTVFAIGTGMAVLAWIGLALGLVIAVLVVELFNRVVRPLLEIRRYADDILQAGVAIATNLDGVDELERARQLATAVPELAGAYLQKLQAEGS